MRLDDKLEGMGDEGRMSGELCVSSKQVAFGRDFLVGWIEQGLGMVFCVFACVEFTAADAYPNFWLDIGLWVESVHGAGEGCCL